MKPSLEKLLSSLPPEIVNHIQHLERMRADFVANVSHELRTPLTVIHGYLETLIDESEDDARKKIFLQMHQHTLRMENLIENLLLLSQLENEEIKMQLEESVAVGNLLQVIAKEASELSDEQQHKIELRVDDTLLIRGSSEELRSLFSNIIFNAIKYTPAHGKITIEWYLQKHQAIFKVTDTGIGIAKEHIARITERFYRVDPARSRASGGTGLGLAIAKHILIRHEAELIIESTPGKGSTFTCIFPRSRMSTQAKK